MINRPHARTMLAQPKARSRSWPFAVVSCVVVAAIMWPLLTALPRSASAAQPDVIIEDLFAGTQIGTPADLLRSLIDNAKPVNEHKVLDSLVGEWRVESSFLPAPGFKPIVSAGTATIRPVIGGRFVESNVKLAFEGVESESLTIFGFDTRHKHYTLHAVDSFATYAVNAAGPYDPAGRVITFSGEVFEPSPDEKLPGTTYPFEMAFDFSAKDRVLQKVRLRLPDQSWFDMLTVTFERK